MKNTNFILSFLFFAVLGTVFSLGLDISPFFGMALGFAAYIPMPVGVLGDNVIPNTQLTPEAQAEAKLIIKLDERISKSMLEANKGLITKDQLEFKLKAINDALKGIEDKGIDLVKFEKSFNDLAADVQKLSEHGTSTKGKTINQIFVEKQQDIEDFKNKKTGILTMVIKADTVRASVTSNPQGMMLNNIGQLPEPAYDFTNFFTVLPVSANSNGVIRYIDWDIDTTVRAAAAIAEGGTFPESTAKWIGYSLLLEKIGDSVPVSEEMLQDNTWTQSELENFLKNNVMRVENQNLYNGDGISPNISGIYTLSPTFDTAAYAISTKAKTTTPDVMDLIKVLRKEIENGTRGKYNVNVVFMSPEEYTETVLVKDTTGRRIREQLIEIGVTIIPSSFVTDDQLVIGDGKYANIYQIEDYQVEIDRNGTDFVDGMLTMRAKKRMALLIRQADRSGFLKVTSVDAALTAITAA